jgi:hypothetical protein
MKTLKMVHVSTIRNFDGLLDFTVFTTGDKEYTFVLKSERDAKQGESLIKHKHYGKAMNFLKKVCVREEEK